MTRYNVYQACTGTVIVQGLRMLLFFCGIMLIGGDVLAASANSYEFTLNTLAYDVTSTTTVNGGTLAGGVSLVAGFTVKSGATVNWNFNLEF